jgi:hypothetical protein
MRLPREYIKEAEKTIIANLSNKDYVVGPKNISLRFRKLMEFINRNRTATSFILDIGSGAYMPIMIDATHACDVSRIAGDILEQSGWNGIFSVASCDKLPYRDKSMSLAVCCEVIEHLPDYEMVVRTFQEIDRVAKKWHMDTPLASRSGFRDSWNIEPTHKQFFSMDDLKRLAAPYGAKIETGDNHAFITKE